MIKSTSFLHVRAWNSGIFWFLHLGGWLGMFLVAYLSLWSNDKPPGYRRVVFAVAVVGCLGTLLLRYWARKNRELSPVALALRMIVPALLISAAMGLTFEIFARMDWCGGCYRFSVLSFLAYVAFQMYVLIGWCGLYLVITTNRKVRAQSEALLRVTELAHEAQLRMLRYQLNPHFLFNTLNAISTLLLDGEKHSANKMLERLSVFLRYSLDADPMQRMTLRQEIQAISLYLEIEKVRFCDRMQVHMDIDRKCWEGGVPSFLLQPVVENAVKYAVAKCKAGGTITLRARLERPWLHLTVMDDGPGWIGADRNATNSTSERHGVGLSNTENRLRALYGDNQSLHAANRKGGGFQVDIFLPFEPIEQGA